jgi:hypothetical protein
MPEQKIVQDPQKNAYQVGIAYRLKVDPKRVNVIVRVNPNGGGMLIDVAVDGRDLNAQEAEMVRQYFEEEMHGVQPRIVGERDVSKV